jgi:hypothetical protein
VKGLVTTVALILSGCTIVSQPPRPFTADAVRENSGAAYLWSAGKVKQPVFSMQDFAIVTRIDDKPISPEYRPAAGVEPLVTWRIDIPAGKHVIEILNKETSICLTGYLGPACVVVEKSSHWVELTAEPSRAYTPIVDEKCGRKWFWIADSGQLNPAGAKKMSPIPFIDRVPAVGGETPPEGPCPESTTEAADSH